MRTMPSRSKGRRTFVGLTVHGRTEGRLESHLQSSPAEGITVTKAEVKPRGELTTLAVLTMLRKARASIHGAAGHRAVVRSCASRSSRKIPTCSPAPQAPPRTPNSELTRRRRKIHMLCFLVAVLIEVWDNN